jgi:hypothetical protein
MWNDSKTVGLIIAWAISLQGSVNPSCRTEEPDCMPEVLNAYVLDQQQLASLYEGNESKPIQKRQDELTGEWYFYVVEIQNRGRIPFSGTICVNYEHRIARPCAKHVRLGSYMESPDYFIWLAGRALVDPDPCFPNISAQWIPDEK